MRRMRPLLCIALTMVVVGAATLPANAKGILDDKPSIMEKKLYWEGRHAITPLIGMTLNSEYQHNLLAGLNWRYFATGWLGVGVDLAAGTGFDTGLVGQINRELSTPTQSFALDTTSLQLVVHVSGELIPFSGKALMFGEEVRIDFHITIGFGMAMVAGSGRIEDSISIMPVAGVGIRLFAADWVAIGFDVNDYIVSRALASNRDGTIPGESYGNNFLCAISVGFFFPTEPEVER